MEQAEKGDLLNYIRRKYRGTMPLDVLRARVLEPLLQALNYLHKMSVIHRDVKPENILVARDGAIKLCDFGFSINSYDERPKSYVGTLEYMAPEILEKKTHLFSEKLDIWSVGVLTYECLVGVSPFHMGSEKDIVAAILEGKYFLPSVLTGEVVSFLKHCLHPNPEQRYSAKELLFIMKGGRDRGPAGDGVAPRADVNVQPRRQRAFSV
jgi:serine/threonine protein kinase